MTSYIIKSILCSGILLTFYHLFLQKEKMHRFNRFYLLASIVFSLGIPLISIEVKQDSLPVAIPSYVQTENFVNDIPQPDLLRKSELVIAQPEVNWLLYAPMIIYTVVALLLFVRLLRNVRHIYAKKDLGEIVPYRGARLVLLPESIVTFTFLNHIFVSEKAYRRSLLEEEVLTHELAHVSQKHSLDVLFVELTQALFWFNPLLFFYKKAIQLNHEFLADEAVLLKHHNVSSYQLLLLDKILYTRQINLTSSFNYSITKQRLAMMTKNTSRVVANCKRAAILVLFICTTLLFSVKDIIAQKENAQSVANKKANTNDGVTEKQFAEYETRLQKMITTRIGRDGREYTYYSMKDNDLVKKLDIIFRTMNEEQKTKATKVPFIPMLPVPEVKRPTQAQLDEWQNSKKFGVWLDERRISNSELKKYKPTDFDYYSISKLEKNAINYGKHYFQIGLSTPKNFRAWQETRTPLTVIPD